MPRAAANSRSRMATSSFERPGAGAGSDSDWGSGSVWASASASASGGQVEPVVIVMVRVVTDLGDRLYGAAPNAGVGVLHRFGERRQCFSGRRSLRARIACFDLDVAVLHDRHQRIDRCRIAELGECSGGPGADLRVSILQCPGDRRGRAPIAGPGQRPHRLRKYLGVLIFQGPSMRARPVRCASRRACERPGAARPHPCPSARR